VLSHFLHLCCTLGPLQSMYLSSCCCPLCTSVLLHSVLVCWRRSVLQTVVVRREDRTYHDRHFLFGFISISLCSRVLYQISIHQMLLCSVCASFSLFLSEQFFFFGYVNCSFSYPAKNDLLSDEHEPLYIRIRFSDKNRNQPP